jgi:hypothetical protein
MSYNKALRGRGGRGWHFKQYRSLFGWIDFVVINKRIENLAGKS